MSAQPNPNAVPAADAGPRLAEQETQKVTTDARAADPSEETGEQATKQEGVAAVCYTSCPSTVMYTCELR
jgi:hypothetical protein